MINLLQLKPSVQSLSLSKRSITERLDPITARLGIIYTRIEEQRLRSYSLITVTEINCKKRSSPSKVGSLYVSQWITTSREKVPMSSTDVGYKVKSATKNENKQLGRERHREFRVEKSMAQRDIEVKLSDTKRASQNNDDISRIIY